MKGRTKFLAVLGRTEGKITLERGTHGKLSTHLTLETFETRDELSLQNLQSFPSSTVD